MVMACPAMSTVTKEKVLPKYPHPEQNSADSTHPVGSKEPSCLPPNAEADDDAAQQPLGTRIVDALSPFPGEQQFFLASRVFPSTLPWCRPHFSGCHLQIPLPRAMLRKAALKVLFNSLR